MKNVPRAHELEQARCVGVLLVLALVAAACGPEEGVEAEAAGEDTQGLSLGAPLASNLGTCIGPGLCDGRRANPPLAGCDVVAGSGLRDGYLVPLPFSCANSTVNHMYWMSSDISNGSCVEGYTTQYSNNITWDAINFALGVVTIPPTGEVVIPGSPLQCQPPRNDWVPREHNYMRYTFYTFTCRNNDPRITRGGYSNWGSDARNFAFRWACVDAANQAIPCPSGEMLAMCVPRPTRPQPEQPAGECPAVGGNPVELASGAKVEAVKCLELGGGGLPIGVGLRYSTQLVSRGLGAGNLAAGWTVSYSRHLVLSQSGTAQSVPCTYKDVLPGQTTPTTITTPATIVWLDEQGTAHNYLQQGTTSTYLPQGTTSSTALSQLTHDATARQYTLTWRNGMRDVYDAHGNLIRVVDRFGNQTRISLPASNIKRIEKWPVDPATGALATSFTQALELVHSAVSVTSGTASTTVEKLTSIRDASTNGLAADLRTLTLGYDTQGRLVRVTDALGYATAYAYDSLGYLTERRDANMDAASGEPAAGKVMRYVYEQLGERPDASALGALQTVVTPPSGSPVPVAISATHPDSCEGSAMASGRVVRGVVACGGISGAVSGGGCGQSSVSGLPHQKDLPPFGDSPLPYRHVLRRVVRERLQSSAGSTLWENRFVWQDDVSSADANSYHLSLESYDYPSGVPTRRTQELFRFDAAGRILRQSARNAPGVYTSMTYSPTGLLASQSTVGQDSRPRTLQYNAWGELIQLTEGGKTTTLARDGFGKTTRVTDPVGRQVKYTYCEAPLPAGCAAAHGALLEARRCATSTCADAADLVTTYQTDRQGRVTSVTLPDGTVHAFTFDAQGYPDKRTYDSGTGRLNLVEDFDHDWRGYLRKHVNPQGSSTLYTVNKKGWPTLVTDPGGYTHALTYDRVGNVKQVVNNSGGVAAAQAVTTRVWDVVGPEGGYDVVRMTDAEGAVTTLTYDANGEPLSISLSGAGVSSRTASFTRLYGCMDDSTPGNTGCNSSQGFTKVITQLPGRTGRALRVYNAHGQLVRERDPRGVVSRYVYDDLTGWLTQVLQGTDIVAGQPAISAAWSYTYDNAGQLLSLGGPDGLEQAQGYDTLGRLAWLRRGNVTEGARGVLTHDKRDRVTTVHELVGGSGTSTTGAQRVTQRTYDGIGRLTAEVLDPAGQNLRTTFGYTSTAAGDTDRYNLRTVRGPRADLDDTVRYSYGPRGLLQQVTDAAGSSWTYTYNALGHLTQHAGSSSRTTTYGRDRKGRLTSLTQNGRTESFTYDAEDHVVTHTGLDGRATRACFDAAGRLERLDRPDGAGALDASCTGTVNSADDARFAYDDADNLVSVTDYQVNPAGVSTTYGYDAAGRRTSRSRDGRTLTYGLNPSGSRASLGYFGNGSVSFGMDSAGRPRQVDPWGTGATTFAYRGTGTLASVSHPSTTLGLSSAYTYDGAERLTGLAFTKAATTGGAAWNTSLAYTYKALDSSMVATASEGGLLATVTQSGTGGLSASHGTLKLRYDAQGRLLRTDLPGDTSGPGPQSLPMAHDAAGNLTSLGLVPFSAGVDDRVATASGNGFIQYDAAGNLTRAPAPGLLALWSAESTTGDTLGRIALSGTATYAAGQVGSAFSFSGTAALTAADSAANAALTQGLTVEAWVKLAPSTATWRSVVDKDAGVTGSQDFMLAISSSNTACARVWTGANTLRQVCGTTALLTNVWYRLTMSYDRRTLRIFVNGTQEGSAQFAGNEPVVRSTATLRVGGGFSGLIDEVALYAGARPPGAGTAVTRAYDAAGRLVSSSEAGRTTTYRYDGLGNLVQQCADGTCLDLVVDDAGGLPEMAAAISGGGVTLYAYGPAGPLAEQARTSTGAATTWRHVTDAQGSVRGLLDGAGNVVGTRSYDALGRVRGGGGTASRLGFTGEWTGTEGLVYLRARHYDPALGRFPQRDRFAGDGLRPESLNRYAYAAGNPIHFTDPSGHDIFYFPDGVTYDHDSFFVRMVNLLSGMGDSASFGLTRVLRRALGYDNIDPCSYSYRAGRAWGTAAADVAGLRGAGHGPQMPPRGRPGSVVVVPEGVELPPMRSADPGGLPQGNRGGPLATLEHSSNPFPYLGRGSQHYEYDSKDLPLSHRINGIINAIADARRATMYGTGNLARFNTQAWAQVYERSGTLHVNPRNLRELPWNWSADANFAFNDTLHQMSRRGEIDLLHIRNPYLERGTAQSGSITADELRQSDMYYNTFIGGDNGFIFLIR